MHNRRGFETRSNPLGDALHFERAGDDAANEPNPLPFLGEFIVAPRTWQYGERLQMD